MVLLDEIRTDLVNSSANLSNTLRKAKILASEIGLPEFREWVDFELSGYTDKDKIPSYRKFHPTNYGTFSGSFGSMVRNVVLPTDVLPDPIKDFAENLTLVEGVGTLEGMLAQESRFLKKWPPEFVMQAQEYIQISKEMELVDAHQPLQPYLISGILDNVKNRLLDFILGLQENNVTSESLENGTVDPEVTRNLFNIHINGNENIVTIGENVHQEINLVQKGDFNSLVSRLRELNVDSNDLDELEEAVSSEPDAPDGQFGPKVHAWLGGMISKAASGMWKISLEAAPKVLMDALRGYYGN